jgi:hypothetical protein
MGPHPAKQSERSRLHLQEIELLWLYAIPFGIGSGGNFVVLPVLAGRCLVALLLSTLLTALVRTERHHGQFVIEG